MEVMPIVLVVLAIGIAGWLSQRSKRKMDEYRRRLKSEGEYVATAPEKSLTRAQRRVEEFRSTNPLPAGLSVEEVARAEADDLKLDDIRGSQGLTLQVKLRVWHRDIELRNRCDGDVRYETDPEVTPDSATIDQVRLVCDGELRHPADGTATGADTGPASDGDDDETGNNPRA